MYRIFRMCRFDLFYALDLSQVIEVQWAQWHWLPHLWRHVLLLLLLGFGDQNPYVTCNLWSASLLWISYHMCSSDKRPRTHVSYLCVSMWVQVCRVGPDKRVTFTYAWGGTFPADHWSGSACVIWLLGSARLLVITWAYLKQKKDKNSEQFSHVW